MNCVSLQLFVKLRQFRHSGYMKIQTWPPSAINHKSGTNVCLQFVKYNFQPCCMHARAQNRFITCALFADWKSVKISAENEIRNWTPQDQYFKSLMGVVINCKLLECSECPNWPRQWLLCMWMRSGWTWIPASQPDIFYSSLRLAWLNILSMSDVILAACLGLGHGCILIIWFRSFWNKMYQNTNVGPDLLSMCLYCYTFFSIQTLMKIRKCLWLVKDIFRYICDKM